MVGGIGPQACLQTLSPIYGEGQPAEVPAALSSFLPTK